MQKGSAQKITDTKNHRKGNLLRGYKSVVRPGTAIIALLLSLLNHNPLDFGPEVTSPLNKGDAEAIITQEEVQTHDPKDYYQLIRLTLQKLYPEYSNEFAEDKLVLFEERSPSGGCGIIEKSELGTYCREDTRIYVDPTVVDLLKEYGATGDYILHFIIAHEINHDVQNILGYLDKFVDSSTRELNADCLAGVVIHHMQKGGNHSEDELIISFRNTAAAIGDNRDNNEPGRTHPNSYERVIALDRGYDSGDKDRCFTTYGELDQY